MNTLLTPTDAVDVDTRWKQLAPDLPKDKILFSDVIPGGCHWSWILPRGTTLRLVAQAQWLVCHDVCIPESATLELLLPVAGTGATPGSTPWTAQFEQAAAQRPQPLQGWNAALQRSGRDLLLTLEPSGAVPAALPPVEVFPFAEQLIETAVHELHATPRGYALKMRLLPDAAPPATLQGIVVAQGSAAPWGGAGPMAEFSAPLREVAAIQLPDGARRLDGQPTRALALRRVIRLADAWRDELKALQKRARTRTKRQRQQLLRKNSHSIDEWSFGTTHLTYS